MFTLIHWSVHLKRIEKSQIKQEGNISKTTWKLINKDNQTVLKMLKNFQSYCEAIWGSSSLCSTCPITCGWNFPVIARCGIIEWPDLSPLDLFTWWHLKSKIFAIQPETLDCLWKCISNECQHNNIRFSSQYPVHY